MRYFLSILLTTLLISCSTSPSFELVDSKHTGIDFINSITESDSLNVLTCEYIYNGAGVGAGDLNNDGLTDLVFAGNQVSSRIYLNEGNWKFRDITSNFKGLTNDQWFSGVALADINADGWLDIYLTSTGMNDPDKRCNRLWINSGEKNGKDPVFEEMAAAYGIDNSDYSVSAAFFDYDQDGWPDLYVLNNIVNSEITSAYRPKIADGSAPNNDRLYHNNGNGTFTDVTIKAGILYEGFGLGLAISDLNKDGYPDIYISNDLISNDILYINQGDGTFLNETASYLSYQSKTSKGNDIADINNDGNPEIFTLDMMPEAYFRKKQTINGFSYLHYAADQEFGFEHQYERNMLHIHNGFLNGKLLPFSETGQLAGVFQTDWSWAALFADFDNDGDKDLFVTNGFPKDIRDKDWTRLKVAAAGSLASNELLINMIPELKISNIVFENVGSSRFKKRSDWLPVVPSFSYGAVLADLDNDGDPDLVINNINQESFVLRNKSVEKSKVKTNFISIRLTGKKNNSLALGAKVEIWSNGKYQYAEQYLTRGYASSVDPVIHFGLSEASKVDSLRVIWPCNRDYCSILKNFTANQIIQISEDNMDLRSPLPEKTNHSPLFFTQCDGILNYLHEQTDFNDFDLNQKIIPHKFSQIGPAMAIGDIDNDGYQDLIVGSTNKLPTKVFLRTGNSFEETRFEGLSTLKEFSESDLTVVDTDNDGDNDVIAIAGGYENYNENEYRHYLYENRSGVFTATLLPVPQFPASVVRPCDFDNDGDIDLFIGSRVKKSIFPYANHSWILTNNNGKFTADPLFRLNLGMVTDAIWSDFNNDGWKDLIVAREWNSVVIMKNIGGNEFVPLILPELEAKHGIWYSISAGDFDQDGDDDYIAGNLGENHRFTVNDDYPLNLYAIDLEPDGIIDPIMTGYWEDDKGKMTEFPVNYLDELWSQSAFLKARIKDYSSFGYLGFNDIINESIMKRLEFSLYVNTTSSYILWNDNDSCRWEKLPEEAQSSPLKKIIVHDLNKDKYPDLIVAGNDYSYDLSTGYYDANKGLILLNKGGNGEYSKSSLSVIQPSESGFWVTGMIGSLLWFEGDTSLVIAGINRGRAVAFKKIR